MLRRGILREEAQEWADKHGMQTLTTVIGLLMDKKNPMCLNLKNSKLAWTKYVKGASAVAAWTISRGEAVTVLSPPPPQRFNPHGFTSFQMIEAPILHWAASLNHVSLQIKIVHPMVEGAEDFRYQIWPVDEIDIWSTHFKAARYRQRTWRVPSWDHCKALLELLLILWQGEAFGKEWFDWSVRLEIRFSS